MAGAPAVGRTSTADRLTSTRVPSFRTRTVFSPVTRSPRSRARNRPSSSACRSSGTMGACPPWTSDRRQPNSSSATRFHNTISRSGVLPTTASGAQSTITRSRRPSPASSPVGSGARPLLWRIVPGLLGAPPLDQVPHEIGQLPDLECLLQELVRACSPPVHIRLVDRTEQRDRRVRQPRIAPQPPRHLPPVHRRHHHVQQHRVRTLVPYALERLVPVERPDDVEPRVLQDQRHELGRGRLV